MVAVGPHIEPLGGALGARVTGVDLSQSIDDDAFDAVHAAFLEYLVLVFPDQDLTPEQQRDFTARFGPVEEHPLKSRTGAPGCPEILVISHRPGLPGARNDDWHTDISFAECPPAATVLHAIQVPDGHGDTMFCNMYKAYESLSPGFQETLQTLSGVHSAAGLQARNNAPGTDANPIAEIPPPSIHPVVRTHPENKRKSLFVSDSFTVAFDGMSEAESRPVLDYLLNQATRPENVCRHRWSKGDVVMWDNRCTLHYAVADLDDTMVRIMHRATAGGDRPV